MKTERHKLIFYLLFAAISAMTILFDTGCRRGNRLYPFRWESYGADTDSLTLTIDNGLYRKLDPDSLSDLVGLLEKQAEKKKGIKDRADYFRALVMIRMDERETADSLFQCLLERVDSASNPYLYNRLHYQTGSDEISPENYAVKFSRLEYFRNVGDPVMSAAGYIDLANLLLNIKDADEAIESYRKADSLLNVAGFHELAIPIKKNIAEALQMKGDSIGGIRILKDLLKDPYILSQPVLHYNILNDYLTESYDTLAAREMINILENKGLPIESDCRLSTFLSEIEFDKGNYREALRLARAGYQQATIDEDEDVRAVSMHRLADAFKGLGISDSAYWYLSREIVFVDSMNLAQKPMEIQAMETGRIIKEKKMERELKHGKRMLWVTIFVFIVFICIIVAAGVVVWRIHSLRLEKAKTSLEKEKAHRRLMATQILVEEKDALLNSLNRDLREMEEKGEISSGAKGHIVNPIKTHIVQSQGREAFLETFSELRPDFTERLKAQAPDLTDTDIRLAKYIVIGLDNKQIATTLRIRPESVKQARWRLRSKLHLPSGSSLEEYLKRIIG